MWALARGLRKEEKSGENRIHLGAWTVDFSKKSPITKGSDNSQDNTVTSSKYFIEQYRKGFRHKLERNTTIN